MQVITESHQFGDSKILMEYNPADSSLLLDFDYLVIKNDKDLETLKNKIINFIITHSKKKPNVRVRYHIVEISNEMLPAYTDFCKFMIENYYNAIARFATKNFTEHLKLEIALNEKKLTSTKIHRTFVDQFIIGDIIGNGKNIKFFQIDFSGTYGTVRYAVHKANGKRAVVKILSKNDINYLGIGEFVEREIKIHSMLSHKHIIKLLKATETHDAVYLFMEYAPGGDLELQSHEPLEENLVKKYAKQTLEALDYLHNTMHVMHRDIQNENICLDENGNVKLVDFGMADFFTPNEKKHRQFVGNSQYAAPEMIIGEPYDNSVDVWSLGCVIFKLVTGYLPFRYSKYSLLREFSIPLEEEPITSECRDFIYQMLELDTTKRASVKQLLEHDWMKNTTTHHTFCL